MKKEFKICVIALFVMCLFLPITAFAKENGSIKVWSDYQNVEMRLYGVADLSDENELTVNEKFAHYSVDFQAQGVERILEAYVERDRISPDQIALTDEQGDVVFRDLKAGVYLICGSDVEEEDTWICYSPMLVSVSQEVDVFAKIEKLERTGECSVLKIWRDIKEYHEEVEVQLLKDGEVADTVLLNDTNSWHYTWKELSLKHEWKVVEKEVTEGYEVSLEKEGATFVLINTILEEESEDEGTDEEGKLPQTGQLWWPVPVLVLLGVLCLLLSKVITVKDEK